MAAGKVHIIMAGNPTMPSGAFFDAFTRERALWHGIGIDAFDSPNLKGLTLEKLLQLDPLEGGALNQNSVPYLPPSAGYTINIFCGGTDPFMIDPFLFAPYWYPVPVYYFPVGWRRHREPTRFVGFGGE